MSRSDPLAALRLPGSPEPLKITPVSPQGETRKPAENRHVSPVSPVTPPKDKAGKRFPLTDYIVDLMGLVDPGKVDPEEAASTYGITTQMAREYRDRECNRRWAG